MTDLNSSLDLSTIVPSYSHLDLQQITHSFIKALSLSHSGQKTSLGYISTPLPHRPLVHLHQTFQVMSVGGTNFQTALAQIIDGEIVLDDIQQSPLPIFTSQTEFFNFIASHLQEEITFLSVNLAHALDPLLRDQIPDGVLISDSKEQNLMEMYGKQVGVELEYYLQQQGHNITVALTNDTVCLGLARLNHEYTWQGIICGVIGTGINFGFFADPHTFVNLESANFDQFTSTDTGIIVDQDSTHPGLAKFEKEVTGAYLYQHYNLLIDQNHLDEPHASSTDDLSLFAKAGDELHHQIARQLLERSASLAACQITGIYKFIHSLTETSDQSESIRSKSRLTFVIEGSLFWEGYHYQDTVINYIHQLGIPKHDIHLTHVKDSSLLGAAKLVTQGIHIPPKPPEPEPTPEATPTPPAGHESPPTT